MHIIVCLNNEEVDHYYKKVHNFKMVVAKNNLFNYCNFLIYDNNHNHKLKKKLISIKTILF